MAKFFARNINGPGRIARAVWGIGLIVAAGFLWGRSRWPALALAACGLFALFEAGRGWCVMRACGIKTKL
jgi:hypothetical protein